MDLPIWHNVSQMDTTHDRTLKLFETMVHITYTWNKTIQVFFLESTLLQKPNLFIYWYSCQRGTYPLTHR